MNKIEINITVNRNIKSAVSKNWLENVTRQVLEAECVEQPVEMGLVITDGKTVQKLNRIYRSRDEATDVLSFQVASNADQKSDEPFVNAPDGVRHLGEVIISYPQALKQAQQQGQSVVRELALLIVHGMLHLLNYDHELPAEARGMRRRESEILRLLKSK